MKARTVWPIAPKFPTNAPATSAKPPVFAYGTISELRRHSFNGVMKMQSNKRRLHTERNLVQARSECVRLGFQCDTLPATTPDVTSAD